MTQSTLDCPTWVISLMNTIKRSRMCMGACQSQCLMRCSQKLKLLSQMWKETLFTAKVVSKVSTTLENCNTKCLKIKSIFLSLSSNSAWPYRYLYRLANTDTVIPDSAEFFSDRYHTLAETVVYTMSLTTMLSKYEYSTTKPGLGSSLKFHTSMRLNPEEWFLKSMYNEQ